jgi:hypothetical protein
VKKLLLAAGALAGLVVLLLAAVLAYGAHVLRSLGTPEFKQQALARASAALGTGVKARSLDVSLRNGVTLSGLEIANPRGFEGPLLTADAFVLRPRLLSLLSGRMEVRRLALEKPRLALAMNAKGAFNYEKLGAPGTPSPTTAPATLPLRLVLDRLAVEDAVVTVTDEHKATLLRLEGGQVHSRIEAAAGAFEGRGEARVATLDLMDILFVRQARTPITMSRDGVSLAPLRGEVAGGDVGGDLVLHLRGGLRYTTNLDLKGASVETLLKEGRFPRAMTGTLAARASFEGTGGMPTLKGRGRAEVSSCRVSDSKVLGGLALALHVPELANPDFEKCLVEFQLAGGRLDTPSLALKGASVQLTGRGRMVVETGALDYDLSLALARPVFAKVTAREVRGAFRDRGDGFFTVDFRVTGTTAAPRNDLLTRLGAAAATEALKGGIDRLFGKKKQ